MIGISLRQLDVFVCIAATGSVRAAAERLHLTQPAVSMALAQLERQLEVNLFDREKGRLYLSAQGHELLPMAQEITERVSDLQHHARSRAGHLTGALRIGASNTIGNYLVGDLVGPFMGRHPDVSLQVTVDNTQDIVRQLLDHELDLACIEGQISHPRVSVLPWRDDALAIFASPSHPLARHPVLRAEHFRDAKWILRERGSAMRAQAEQALAQLPPGNVLLELGQVESIKQAVIANLGIACLPDAATRDAVETGRLVRLSTPFLQLQRRFSVLLRKDRYHGRVLAAFVNSMGVTLPSGTEDGT